MDELADIIGCRPNFLELLFKDPSLAYHIVFGPQCPYSYRLKGPHAWEGARRAIMDMPQRVIKGMAPGGGVPQKDDSWPAYHYIAYFLAGIVLIFSLWGFFY